MDMGDGVDSVDDGSVDLGHGEVGGQGELELLQLLLVVGVEGDLPRAAAGDVLAVGAVVPHHRHRGVTLHLLAEHVPGGKRCSVSVLWPHSLLKERIFLGCRLISVGGDNTWTQWKSK